MPTWPIWISSLICQRTKHQSINNGWECCHLTVKILALSRASAFNCCTQYTNPLLPSRNLGFRSQLEPYPSRCSSKPSQCSPSPCEKSLNILLHHQNRRKTELDLC